MILQDRKGYYEGAIAYWPEHDPLNKEWARQVINAEVKQTISMRKWYSGEELNKYWEYYYSQRSRAYLELINSKNVAGSPHHCIRELALRAMGLDE